jgi:hypothetical protein
LEPGVWNPNLKRSQRPTLYHFLGLLALRSVSSPLWGNNPADIALIPWAAGMSVTRKTADSYLQLVEPLNVKTVLDQHGQRLYSGGDDLFSWVSTITAKGFGLCPDLRHINLISAERLNQRYFVQLIHDHWFSREVLRSLSTGVGQTVDRMNFMFGFSPELFAVIGNQSFYVISECVVV